MPADNKYGKNGYPGPSSDLPGQQTTIKGFSTPADFAQAKQTSKDIQKRDIGDNALAGMKGSQVPNKPGMARQTDPAIIE